MGASAPSMVTTGSQKLDASATTARTTAFARCCVLGAVNGARRVEKSPGGNNSTAWFMLTPLEDACWFLFLWQYQRKRRLPVSHFQCATSVHTKLQPPRWATGAQVELRNFENFRSSQVVWYVE